MGNMYGDAIYRWNVFVGCEFGCSYCIKSFQAQMKRQKPTIDKNGKLRGCGLCYDYIPHFHEDRINQKFPRTVDDQFIWVGSSGDISFIKAWHMIGILNRIESNPDRTFFFQTKNPLWFEEYIFPENVILGITLETNRSNLIRQYTNAPGTNYRARVFKDVKHHRKAITIEPIMAFDIFEMVDWCIKINPERIYIGYDSKKNYLDEPHLNNTLLLIEELKYNLPKCKIKEKLIRTAWDE